MTNEIFVEIICKLRLEMSDDLFRAVLSQTASNVYETKLNYIAGIALGITEVKEYKRGDIVYVRFESYKLRDNLFDINHCIDHGFAETLNGNIYIKAVVNFDSVCDNLNVCYIGCDINGNEIIQKDYQVTVERLDDTII